MTENINDNKSIVKNDSLDNKKQKYKCNFESCGKAFGKPSRLALHGRIHTGERPFICSHDNCEKSYTRKTHLIRHISYTHEKNNFENLRCENCNKSFINPYSFKVHKNNCMTKNKASYICNICNDKFKKQSQLKIHSATLHGYKPYKCSHEECEKCFSTRGYLKRHLLTHLKGRYICSYECCKDRFDCYSSLRHHLTTSHPKKCNICSEEFLLMSQLRTHLNKHVDHELRETFFCPFTPCERYYLEEKNLHSHIKSKHNSNFKGFSCTICSKTLVTKQKLKQHMKIHDPNYQRALPKTGKIRKPRKDKGISRTDYAILLSGLNLDAMNVNSEDYLKGINLDNINGNSVDQECLNVNVPITKGSSYHLKNVISENSASLVLNNPTNMEVDVMINK